MAHFDVSIFVNKTPMVLIPTGAEKVPFFAFNSLKSGTWVTSNKPIDLVQYAVRS